VRSTAAPYTESRLTRSVANERVGFPVVEQFVFSVICLLQIIKKLISGHDNGIFISFNPTLSIKGQIVTLAC
jgi:hypothetical protein